MDMAEEGGSPQGGRSSVVAVYETDEQARMGFDALRSSGVPQDRITVVGAGGSQHEAGLSDVESATARGAGRGALLGGVVGAVVSLMIPGGAVVFASGLVAAGVGALAGGSLGVLAEVGVPNDNLRDYEEDLADGRYLVVVHGREADARAAFGVLDMTDTEELDLFLED
jgi:Heat induced stress protein YflT domain